MLKEQNAILQAINTLIDNKIKKLKFNYYVDGVVTTVNNNNTYNVHIDGKEYNSVSAKNDTPLSVGSVVKVLIRNGNWTKKIIDNPMSINDIYPIGSTYHTTNNITNATTVNEMFGGTWTKIGSRNVGSFTEYVWRRTS